MKDKRLTIDPAGVQRRDQESSSSHVTKRKSAEPHHARKGLYSRPCGDRGPLGNTASRRSRLTILDRDGLEHGACEFYHAARDLS